jgi:hypothetical protein
MKPRDDKAKINAAGDSDDDFLDSSADESSEDQAEAEEMLKLSMFKHALSAMERCIIEGDEFTEEQEEAILNVNNVEINEHCIEELAKLELPSNVKTIHTLEPLPVFMLFMGAKFFDNYKTLERHSLQDLDRACHDGDYQALQARTNINLKVVLNKATPEPERLEAIERIKTDVFTMSEFYWTVGHLHACRIYHIIGNHYNQEQDEKMHEHYAASARHFNWAVFLESKPESKYLMKLLYSGKGISGCGWENLEIAKKEVMRHIPLTRQTEILKEVHDEMIALFAGDKNTQQRGGRK